MIIKHWHKTHWGDLIGTKTGIRIINFLLKDEPIISLQLCDLAHIPSVVIDDNRKCIADLTCPIIVQETNGQLQMILDGHHRRQKALDINSTHILAKIFRGDLLDENK